MRETSGFEFYNHPREEYFEQPASYFADGASSDESSSDDGSRARQLVPTAVDHSLRASLASLERSEMEGEAEEVDCTAAVDRQLAAISRRCERRAAARQGEGGQPSRIQRGAARRAAAPPVVASAAAAARKNTGGATPGGSVPVAVAVVQRHCAAMGAARLREEARLSAGSLWPPASEDVGVVREALDYMEAAEVSAALLKATGIGVELNKRAWRQHPARDIAARATALVQRWRSALCPRGKAPQAAANAEAAAKPASAASAAVQRPVLGGVAGDAGGA